MRQSGGRAHGVPSRRCYARAPGSSFVVTPRAGATKTTSTYDASDREPHQMPSTMRLPRIRHRDEDTPATAGSEWSTRPLTNVTPYRSIAKVGIKRPSTSTSMAGRAAGNRWRREAPVQWHLNTAARLHLREAGSSASQLQESAVPFPLRSNFQCRQAKALALTGAKQTSTLSFATSTCQHSGPTLRKDNVHTPIHCHAAG
jgi:hypothetical protein